MSESRRRSETHAAQPRPQGSADLWIPADQGIEPREAAAFRRRLDYQGSAELIPTAGPDAAADQGPAIKAVWEPAPPGAAGHASRRRDRRGASGPGDSPERRARRRRRRSAIIGGVAAVALGITGYSELTGKGPAFTKGAATTILPAASSSADDGQAANSSLGTGITLTNRPSHSPTASSSTSASASASPTGTATAAQTKPAAGGGSAAPGQPSTSASPSPTSGSGGGNGGGGGGGGGDTPTPTPAPTHTSRSCFLIFCN